MRKLALTLCLAILPLALSGVARATPPTHVSVDETFTTVYSCGLTESGVFHRSFTTFFDQDGNETHTLEQATFEAVITNPARPGRHSSIVAMRPFASNLALRLDSP